MRPEDEPVLQSFVPKSYRRKQGGKCAGHGEIARLELERRRYRTAIGNSVLLLSIGFGRSSDGIAIQIESQSRFA